MIHEIAEIDVIHGHEAAFETAVAAAAPHFEAARGCRSFALNRSIEQPQRYRLVVGWDSVEDHMVHFSESAGFQAWRALVGPHFASPPRVEHVEIVIDGLVRKEGYHGNLAQARFDRRGSRGPRPQGA